MFVTRHSLLNFAFISIIFHLLLDHTTDARTVEDIKKEADDAKEFSLTFKASVDALRQEKTDYQAQVLAITTSPATPGNAQPAVKPMAEQKTNAEEAMKNGMELKKKVSVLLNKAEDIKFQAESASKSAENGEQQAKTEKKTDEENSFKEIKQKALDAIVAIDAGTPDLKTFLTDVQTGIDTAREKFYAADLEIGETDAVAKLKSDSEEADSQQKDVSSKLTAYENNHKQKMEDAIKLKSTDEAVVIESKRECQEALKLARELKYEAESARSLATSLVAAAAIVENSQASAGDKQTALAAKNKAENEVIKLLDVILLPVDTAKIPDAITKATEGRANIAKLFAALPFTAKKPVDDRKADTENTKTTDEDKTKAGQEQKEADLKKKADEAEKRAQQARKKTTV